MALAQSFPPIIGEVPQILILGSSPGQVSLIKQQYFAHPRNAFWPILSRLFQFDETLSYEQRVAVCKTLPIVIWDVLAQCERQGSLDSAIQNDSQKLNDFPSLLQQYPTIHSVFCNGATSFNVFSKKVQPLMHKPLRIYQLPSTSPAHARMTFFEKLHRWSEVKKAIT